MHKGYYWNIKLFDEWAKGREKIDITAMMLNISHHKVDATFLERIVVSYKNDPDIASEYASL